MLYVIQTKSFETLLFIIAVNELGCACMCVCVYVHAYCTNNAYDNIIHLRYILSFYGNGITKLWIVSIKRNELKLKSFSFFNWKAFLPLDTYFIWWHPVGHLLINDLPVYYWKFRVFALANLLDYIQSIYDKNLCWVCSTMITNGWNLDEGSDIEWRHCIAEIHTFIWSLKEQFSKSIWDFHRLVVISER